MGPGSKAIPIHFLALFTTYSVQMILAWEIAIINNIRHRPGTFLLPGLCLAIGDLVHCASASPAYSLPRLRNNCIINRMNRIRRKMQISSMGACMVLSGMGTGITCKLLRADAHSLHRLYS